MYAMIKETPRARANPPMRQRLASAPLLFHNIRRYAQCLLVTRAQNALEVATDQDVADTVMSGFGVMTPVIRAAGQKGKAGEASAVAFVTLALQRGFSPDTPSPGFAAWELQTPPLVAAASYGYTAVVKALLDAGASPGAVDVPDRDNALHAALEHAATLAFMLGHSESFRTLVSSANRYGKTAFTAALLAEPHKAAHKKAIVLLAPHVVLSDDDVRIIRAHRKLGRLQALIMEEASVPPRPLPAATTRFWQPAWHWSFPSSDRAALRVTYELARRGWCRLPPELWLRIFGWVERGWFAAHEATVAAVPGGAQAASASASAQDGSAVARATIHSSLARSEKKRNRT